MKKLNRCCILLLIISLSLITMHAKAVNIDSLLNVLDDAIAQQGHYDGIREARITKIRQRNRKFNGNYIQQYNDNKALADEYKIYRHDSTVKYLNKNLDLALKNKDTYRTDETRIKLIYIFGASGMYLEANNLIHKIDRSKLDNRLLLDYYLSCRKAYGEVGAYSNDKESREKYSKLAKLYRDSMIMVLPKTDPMYYHEQEYNLIDENKLQEALQINDTWMKRVKQDTPEYSVVCYSRSEDYKALGDKEMQEYWLILSAISDVRAAVKDQASLWMLAGLLSERGDIERSYKYIRDSWGFTKFYNSPLRNLQTLNGLSAIDIIYQAKIEKQNVYLRIYLSITVLLAILLTIAVFVVRKQMKKLSVAHNNLSNANERLSESNIVKEEYIGRFLTLCSFYVDKLESFRNLTARKAKTGQLADVLSTSKLNSMKAEDIADLMTQFDRAFLRIFPNFISEFNALLDPNQQIKMNSGELLNTELRIFALIRLGVDDSSRIAEFLHYSANTIYNYRARVKKASIVPREDFEKMVMNIGKQV